MRPSRNLTLILGIAVLFCVCSTVYGNPYGGSAAFKGNIYNPGLLKPTDSALKVKVGDPAPDFTLPAVSGEEVSQEDTLRKALRGLQRELVSCTKGIGTDGAVEAEEEAAKIRKRIRNAEAEWRIFQRSIAEKYPVTEGQAYELVRIQRSLTQDEAIVGWLDALVGAGEAASENEICIDRHL